MGLWYLLRIVSQRSLLSCRLDFEDRWLDRASLFPLFDDEGRTRMVLITAEENGRIILANWAPGLFVRDWALRNRLRLRFTDLNDASMWDEEHFEDLWHFDPRWVLGDERYQGHGAVPHLRSTNIPGCDQTMSAVAFDASLVFVGQQIRPVHPAFDELCGCDGSINNMRSCQSSSSPTARQRAIPDPAAGAW